MSAGKALAQIGHGGADGDARRRLDTGLQVVGAGGETWSRLAGSAVAVVRDGGLTELEPGSETVLVFRPLERMARERS